VHWELRGENSLTPLGGGGITARPSRHRLSRTISASQEMKFLRNETFAATIFCALCVIAVASRAAEKNQDRVRSIVDNAIRALMVKDHIPGMAVGIAIAGTPRVFNYGLASREPRKPVTDDTLFELGSVSKTFTATLASWAEINNQLSLSEKVGKYFPSLQNSPFGNVSLLNLGTHTPGGLPLQVPEEVRNEDQLLRYFKDWRPAYAPGTYRTYNNPGIGTLGVITAKSMGQDFTALIEQRLLPALGMTSSFINVPASRMADYAQGYTQEGKAVRMSVGVLSSEAYGIKSTAVDMIRYVQASMNLLKVDGELQRAIENTHKGYFKAGVMTQDLIWEQYPYPVELNTLQEGNSPEMIFDPSPVTAIRPPQTPQDNVWINKTGSTNGFGAYVAFVPAKRLGIVILANTSFPIEDRVTVAYTLLRSLADIR
jgi:beta-lactamase class C